MPIIAACLSIESLQKFHPAHFSWPFIGFSEIATISTHFYVKKFFTLPIS